MNTPSNAGINKTLSLILIIVMLMVAIAYLIVIDTLVLQEYHTNWTQLDMLDRVVITIPALWMLFSAGVLFVFNMTKGAHTTCSPYIGTKFGDGI